MWIDVRTTRVWYRRTIFNEYFIGSLLSLLFSLFSRRKRLLLIFSFCELILSFDELFRNARCNKASDLRARLAVRNTELLRRLKKIWVVCRHVFRVFNVRASEHGSAKWVISANYQMAITMEIKAWKSSEKNAEFITLWNDLFSHKSSKHFSSYNPTEILNRHINSRGS